MAAYFTEREKERQTALLLQQDPVCLTPGLT